MPRSTSAASMDAPLAVANDPIWAAMLASPVVADDLSEEERRAFDQGIDDIRAGRVVTRDVAAATIARMRADQDE